MGLLDHEKPEGIREINVQDVIPILDDIYHLQAQVTFEPGPGNFQ